MKKIFSIIIILLVIIGGYFLLNKKQTQVSSQPIKIGALLILSGDFAKVGEATKNGMEIALSEYNSKPDVTSGKLRKVEVIYEDTHADPKTAVSAYQKLTSLDKVDAIVGPLLQVEMAAITPLVKADNMPVISVAPIPTELRGLTSNPLVIWPDPTLESRQMADYVYAHGSRTVGILNTKDAWESEVSGEFAKEFTKLGGVVSDQEVVLPDSKDESLPVTKIIAVHPDSVFLGTYNKFVYFVKKLHDLNYKGKLYSIEIDTSLSDETKPYSDNLQFISPAFYTPEFVAKYKERYKDLPSIPIGQAYDAMNLTLSLVSKVNQSDPIHFKQDMLKQMEELTEFDGTSGKITFSADHLTTFPLSFFQINNGTITKIQ